MKIRVIDYQSPQAPTEFAQGLKEIGFAVIENHPVSPVLIEEAYRLWYDFFKSDYKHDFAFDKKTHEGYVSTAMSETAKGYDKKDLKEFYHYYLGRRCPESCREVSAALYVALNKMAGTLLQWIENNSPAEIKKKYSMPLSDMIKNSDHTLLRLIHYPPLTGDEPKDALRAAAHEDINLLTLLPAATADGLQVKDAQGNWINVPINPGWIIVNVGDMLQECSGRYYPSTSHRVLNPAGELAKKSRLSMPLFLHPREEVRLSDQYTAGSYRDERFKEIGLK
ncbi:MAG: isopenicillin N synthase family oxygenase [Gammaproteobacteria bacterium]|nr:isopenicillin N synthase family oxygenase [Gammaproteobacteria bacterium]